MPQFVAATRQPTGDLWLQLLFIAGVILLPALGYWFMVMDIRAYLRALRGALVIVANHLPGTPAWARAHTPPCIRAFGLEVPCEEEDVKRAYRRLAEQMHPDRGGDRRRFLQLQQQLEEALDFVRGRDR